MLAGAAGLLAAPWVRLLGRADAAEVAPSRLLVVFSPNGTIHDAWRPEGGPDTLSFPPGSILEPLARHADRLTVISGLGFLDASGHAEGMAAMLTNGGGADTETGGRSVDQVVAAAIGGATRFRSLELGVQTSAWGGTDKTRMCYAGPGAWLTPDDDPASVYDRLFGDLLLSPEAAAARNALRHGILDVARAELDDLRRRVGGRPATLLDTHLQALDEVERSLDLAGTCTEAPEAPPTLDPADNDRFPDLVAAQSGLAVAALACDLARVVTLQLSHTVSPTVFTWLDQSDSHHSLSHASDDQADLVAQFVACERWYAERIADLLDLLAGWPDPLGGSLLDSTLVVWAKELGDPRTHACDDVPFVLAGGGLRGGRLLEADGARHAALLVSICQAFGIELDTFGDPAAGSGPLPGLW